MLRGNVSTSLLFASKVIVMRERSPAEHLTVDQWVDMISPQARAFVESIRVQKRAGLRPLPSSSLIDKSEILSKSVRSGLLDRVATLVDENYCGRSEMCLQFARLVAMSLRHLKLPAREVIGNALYFRDNKQIFSWEHAWVRVGREVIDGNVDSVIENPLVPKGLHIKSYWGDIAVTPSDRKLREQHGAPLPEDDLEIQGAWWPELRDWLECVKPAAEAK